MCLRVEVPAAGVSPAGPIYQAEVSEVDGTGPGIAASLLRGLAIMRAAVGSPFSYFLGGRVLIRVRAPEESHEQTTPHECSESLHGAVLNSFFVVKPPEHELFWN